MEIISKITDRDIFLFYLEAFKTKHFDEMGFFEKQRMALEKLTDDSTNKILYGGAAGGGKSYLGTAFALFTSLLYPGVNGFIGRFKKKHIFESIVQTTLPLVCRNFYIPNCYKINYQKGFIRFENGSNINFIEMAHKPSEDPNYDRFGSTEYTWGWIEEGAQVPPKAATIAYTRIGRHLNDHYGLTKKLLITSNPARNWMYNEIYRPHVKGILPQNKVFIQSLVHDNTQIDKGYPESLEELTGVERQRLLEGDWEYNQDDRALIKSEAMFDLFENEHVEPNALDKWMTCDVALHGSDVFRINIWHGWVVVAKYELRKCDAKQVEGFIRSKARQHGVAVQKIIYDADGVGAFLRGYLSRAIPFVNNGAPHEERHKTRENYQNLKTQCYYKLAQKINKRQMRIACAVDEEEKELIIEELSQVKKKDVDKDGKLKIESKEEIKANIGRSPDYADALMMRIEGMYRRKKRYEAAII